MADGRERVPFANLGAEESRAGEAQPHDARGARGARAAAEPLARLREHFEALVRRPPWPALAAFEGLVAWMNTEEAVAEAARLGLPLWGAPVDVVRRVHDKGFAVASGAGRRASENDELAPLLTVLAPEELEAGRIEAAIASWPAWARADATLKPRWGTSGRGRVAVKGGVVDERARQGLAGLRARGGAVLEPWLARVEDLSSQWLIDADGPRLLGCTRMITRPSGVWLGCELEGDDDGQGSGTPWDGALVAAARPLVEAAAAEGLVGFCGVDAFTWQRDGVVRLRGVVELNARFTGGLVALGMNHGRIGRSTFRIQD